MRPVIRPFLFVTALAVAALMATPCVTSAAEVVVGVILPLSGTQAAVGHMQKNSMTLAVEEVNRRGGVGGEDLKLDVRDSGSQLSAVQSLIDYFSRDKAYPLVLGGGSSRLIDSMAERSQYRGLPLLSITGSRDDITQKGYSYLFRIAPLRSAYPAPAFEYASAALRPSKVALLYEASDYGSSMARAVRDKVKEKGWKLVWDGSFEAGSINLEGTFKELEGSGPDTVFLCAFPPDDKRIVPPLARRLGAKRALMNLVPASFLSGSLASCGEECAGLLTPSLWSPSSDQAARRYSNLYQERFGAVPDYHGAQAYAAVIVAAQALRRAGALEPGAVRESLGSIGLSTPYGYVSFPDRDGHTNQNSPPGYLLRWNGEGFETVWPKGQ